MYVASESLSQGVGQVRKAMSAVQVGTVSVNGPEAARRRGFVIERWDVEGQGGNR